MSSARGDERETQLTRGEYEVGSPAWSPVGARLAFDTAEGGRRRPEAIATMRIRADESAGTIAKLTEGRGAPSSGSRRPGRPAALCAHDPRNSADFYVTAAAPGSPPGRRRG